MNRDFKGVWIPKEIWLNEELTLLEKIIFVEIDSLDNEDNCIAGNEYFAEFCGCSESKVTKAIKKLQELNMIELVSFDGRHRKIRVVKSTMQSSKKYDAESQKVRTNNIDNKQTNNKSISKDIDTEFEFGKKKEVITKPKKPSLYEKCVNLIHEFTDDAILQNMLEKCLQNFLTNSRESGYPFYTNTFKGKLNKLQSLSDDNYTQRKIVQQTADNGWNNFYEIKDNKRSKNVMQDVEHLDGLAERASKRGVKKSEQKF